jgi:hypothetical protein
VVLGQVIEPMAPFTNPDDVKLSRWLEQWRRGETIDWDAESM